MRVLRNVTIVLLIAAAVRYLPEGGTVAVTVEAALIAALGVGFAYVGVRLYREQPLTLIGLGDRDRGMLYAVLALGLLLWAGRTRMWHTGLGQGLWFALLGLAIYAAVTVYRHARSY